MKHPSHQVIAGDGHIHILQWRVSVAEGDHRDVHVGSLCHRLQHTKRMHMYVYAQKMVSYTHRYMYGGFWFWTLVSRYANSTPIPLRNILSPLGGTLASRSPRTLLGILANHTCPNV